MNEKRAEYTRGRDLKRFYGIDIIEYNALLARQNNRCGICNKHMLEFDKKLGVDHDHDTGQIRGLLCNNCNNGIGLLGDKLETLLLAVKYLEDAAASFKYKDL